MGDPDAKRDLDNLSLDPSKADVADPESWDEQPTGGNDAADYLAQKPPHHED